MRHKTHFNILLRGVGGQGILTTGDILAHVFADAGFDVKLMASRGVARRFGEVTCQVRAGQKVFSPVVPQGEFDFAIILDRARLETARMCLRKGGRLLEHGRCLEAKKNPVRKTPLPANMIMLGELSRYLPIAKEVWLKTIQERMPVETHEMNCAAFEQGRHNAFAG